jgi:hypothetical protein
VQQQDDWSWNKRQLVAYHCGASGTLRGVDVKHPQDTRQPGTISGFLDEDFVLPARPVTRFGTETSWRLPNSWNPERRRGPPAGQKLYRAPSWMRQRDKVGLYTVVVTAVGAVNE